MAEQSDYRRFVRAAILRQPGGHVRWKALEQVVGMMTVLEKRELHMALTEAEKIGKQEGERLARRQPWKFTGS